MLRNKSILILSSTEGHLSIADAIKSGLEANGYTNLHLEVEDSAIFPYVLYYRYAPWLHQVVDIFLGSKPVSKVVRKLMERTYRTKTESFIQKHRPEIVISTNYAFNSSLEPYVAQKKFRMYSVVCDPRSFIYVNIAHEQIPNLAFDDIQAEQIVAAYPDANTHSTGWFVRPEFYPPKSIEKAKDAVGLNPEKLSVLVVAGSEGMQRIQDTVSALVRSGEHLSIVVACGKNSLLRQAVELIAKTNQHQHVSVVALPFTQDIAAYFRAADVIMGKAGPNMLFEATACHKPFIATTSLKGQEEGNLQLIHEFGLGFVQTNPRKAAQIVVELAKNPELLVAMLPKIKKMAQYNAGAVGRLVALMEKSGDG